MTKQGVLDVLIVGGGPGGTATAFRARELGLHALVIDFDDLMKRIRDYPKAKLILPDFGGGDKMQFPKGDDLVRCLHFDPIDKDDMCGSWKTLYTKHEVPTQIGIELTGLERDGDLYVARGWNHVDRCEAEFRTKSVVLSIGRGVPRRFDIPGNTDGVAYRLDDAAKYVGEPACVIGGGTSAAEAVIAISNAKTAEKDPSLVYWSYRGDKMPRVSKALADVFFGAYMDNGNIRYYPKSDPVSVVTSPDRKEYLSIRVDTRCMEARPTESMHLEFRKEQCIACIGEDIPEALLKSFGINMATGGPKNKKRMVVNRYLETERPNIYLVGDILSQAYLEADDFAADPAGFREVKHRGNVKSALCDGVLVAGIIQQKLAGKTEIDVKLEYAEPSAEKKSVVVPSAPVETDAPPVAAAETSRQVAETEAFLVRVLPGGDVADEEYPISLHAATTIGRKECDINFENDTLMSDRHASITHTEEGYFLRDDGSTNGVFLRVPEARKTPLESGDLLRVGRQFLLFSADNGNFSVTHYDNAGHEVGRHKLPEKTMVFGRQAPDVTLDPDDGVLSRRHLAVSVEGGHILIKDLKSINGSFLRVRNVSKLQHGDQFRMGQQLLTFSEQPDAVVSTDAEVTIPPAALPPTPQKPAAKPALAAKPAAAAAPAPAKPTAAKPAPAAKPAAAPAAEPAAAAGSGPSVTFKNSGQTFAVEAGQSICDVAEQNGVEISAECHAGVCGSDPLKILSGKENLSAEPGDQEQETLEDICDLEPGPCRLACMLKVTGPVVVEIVKND
jgi:pSer/pThr/pTyr-binding forkhead associated (FHA) protein/thioredoxin reductase/ferredoxin